MDELGEDRVYLSLGSAANDFVRRWPVGDETLPNDETAPDG
jgi:hypothetical protein